MAENNVALADPLPEVETPPEDQLEIEVQDDTPPEDKGKKPLNEPPAEPDDEELSQYSDGVKKRIGKLTHAYHDERRAKESALREREEAIRIANQIFEENKRLQSRAGVGEQTVYTQAKGRIAAELARAKDNLKTAHEAGDVEKIADATAAISKLSFEEAALREPQKSQERALQQEKEGVEIQPANQRQEQHVPAPDPRAVRWLKENQWFGSDEELTGYAYGLHDKLVRSGVNPRTEEYYEKLDSRLREVFPDRFGVKKTPKSPPATVVASSVRTNGAAKKVTLTTSQVAIAKRLGVPLEEYAKQVLKEQSNG